MNMTKAQAKKKLGLTTDYQLAQALGVQRQAVSAWGDKLPQARQWQVQAMLASKQRQPKE